jgi:hypothetical protein
MVKHEKHARHHEQRHVQDSDIEFKIVVRRNRLLGLWAAEKLGLAGDAAAAYAKEVVGADFEEPGDADVIRKILKDFSEKSVAIGEAAVRDQITRLYGVARHEIAPKR